MDYLTNDTDLKKVADAIRAKGGTSDPLAYPSGFVSAIQAIKSAPTGPYMAGEYELVTLHIDGGYTNENFLAKAKVYNHTAVYRGEFSGETLLKEIDFSDPSNNITVVESEAFSNASMVGIELPETITKLGESCFSGATITSLTLPAGITKLPTNTFQGIKRKYNDQTGEPTPISLALPPNLTKIGDGVFASAEIEQIDIPNSVVEIADAAFYYCEALTSITLPPSLQKISRDMFYGCSGLTSITIPASVTTIGDGAFANDAGMTTITCLAETPPTIGANAFTVGTGTTIKVPAASVAAYKAADGWEDYANYIVAM